MGDSITIAAIVKDERHYLLEWVAWYRLLGFDRLRIYSNDSSDGTDDLLAAMATAGLLEWTPWPSVAGRSAQTAAYCDAVSRADTEWLMVADIDEFLVLHEDAGIAGFLARFPADVGAVAVNWRIFGSAGQTERMPEPVVARFTRAGPRGAHTERHTKPIARVARIVDAYVHRMVLRNGRTVDSAGRDVTLERNALSPAVEHRVAQLNHYVLKSAAEFDDKRRRGNAHLPPEAPNRFTTRDGPFFRLHDTNDEEDLAAARRLPALAAEMARMEALIGPAAALAH